ncbi:receptor homology region, transmembrane domain- and RING domain-containing protein 1-like [Phragmites australis]|uniref:receptor homology region, transmembrane domain- and RING domain-containing protein 1-like n=1 Tax=Phragmites australis TaxID=29695 RepID=UPI002D775C1C|nr:receptor homology region, transmembrane domain- and RING domain-containing protein 1-like [Phragmites australis]
MSSTLALAITLALAAIVAAADEPSTANLTLHNLCPFPVWPLVTANAGLPSVPVGDDGEPVGRLDGSGEGLATLAFPPGAWSGRVVARTGCAEDVVDASPVRCETGDAPPVTVAQVSVGGPGGLAAYSVSLVDGFNVAVVITPHGFAEGRQCPTLGCAVDLGAVCPGDARAPGGGCGAGATAAGVFKESASTYRTPVFIGLLAVMCFAVVLLMHHCVLVTCCHAADRRRRRNHHRGAATAGGARQQQEEESYSVELSSSSRVHLVQSAAVVCPYRKEEAWSESTCPVCLADFADGEAVRVLPECMHYFHADCIDTWLRGSTSCPMCRAETTPTPTPTPGSLHHQLSLSVSLEEILVRT